MAVNRLDKESVLRVGSVSAVTGRKVFVTVDKDKNLSELFYDGDILRNTAVGSYIDIRKGFLSLIGKVDGENAFLENEKLPQKIKSSENQRVLSISMVGFIDRTKNFSGGTKELPLVGNEAFLLTKEKVHQIHDLVSEGSASLDIAQSEYEGYDIAIPVDGLMNSHIAIFGNTGSGKSNTLAHLYQNFVQKMEAQNRTAFQDNCRILVFDFNGEYTNPLCLSENKDVYQLSTHTELGDKIPLDAEGLLNIEMLSILADATEKTQKPFLKRALRQYHKINQDDGPTRYLQNIVKAQVMQILQMSDKVKADLLLGSGLIGLSRRSL